MGYRMSNESQTETPHFLDDAYVIDDPPAVEAYIEDNGLRNLLIQAREPLDAAFGKDPAKKLTLAEDDEGVRTLCCVVLVPGDLRQAYMALKSFDERWWLAHARHWSGKLSFDFELV